MSSILPRKTRNHSPTRWPLGFEISLCICDRERTLFPSKRKRAINELQGSPWGPESSNTISVLLPVQFYSSASFCFGCLWSVLFGMYILCFLEPKNVFWLQKISIWTIIVLFPDIVDIYCQ